MKNHRILRENERNDNLSTSKGFTLLELLLAVTIITLVVSVATYAFVSTVRNRVHAHHISVASFMAQDKAEEFKAASYADVTDGSGVDGVYTKTWEVSESDGLKTITITVTFPSSSTSMNSTILKTYKTDY